MAGHGSPDPRRARRLLAYLAQQRYVIKLTAYGLTDERGAPHAEPRAR